MKFLNIVEKLQTAQENEGYLVLIRCGVFFEGIGKDAVILSEKFGLNPICIKEKICKCAIPVSRIEKFLKKVISQKVSVAIYEYNPKGVYGNVDKKYELLKRIVLNPIEESRCCNNCDKCWYSPRRIKNSKQTIEDMITKLEEMGKTGEEE